MDHDLSRRTAISGITVAARSAGALPAAAATPDPVFDRIACHRELKTAYETAVEFARDRELDDDAFEAATDERGSALDDHEKILLSTRPTTRAGAITLLRYVVAMARDDEFGPYKDCLNRLADALA